MAELIFFTLLVLLAGAATSTHYHIVPITSTALCKHYPVRTCFTLEELSSQVNQTDTGNITISFLPGEHLLTWNMMFNGANKVTLKKELHYLSNATWPKITCIKNVKFIFWNLHILTVEELEIYGCELEEDQFGVIRVLNTEHVLIKECWFTKNKVTGRPQNYSQFLGGGAIFLAESRVQIQHSAFVNNSVSCYDCNGGAIFIVSSNVSLDFCNFELNKAISLPEIKGGAGGGLAVKYSTLTITKTAFYGNSADIGGSVFSFISKVTIWSCFLINNTATYYGAGISAASTSLNSLGNMYSGNAANTGGAVFSYRTTASFYEDYFLNNSAWAGSAIFDIKGQTIHISNTTFRGNKNTTENTAVVYITNKSLFFNGRVLFYDNHGSLLTINTKVHFYGTTIYSNNSGGELGGAIRSIATTITFEATSTTIISGNTASYGGGLSVEQSTILAYGSIVIMDNRADTSGGGIYAFQSVIEFRPEHRVYSPVLQHTFITNNIANSNGGGVHLTVASIKISNSYICIYGNIAKQYGGGVFMEQASNIELGKWVQEGHKTIVYTDQYTYIRLEFHNNSALRGGAVYVLDSTNAGVLCIQQINLRSKQCFLQTLALYDTTRHIPTNTINTFFENNTAQETGSDIYGGLLDRCTASGLAEIHVIQPQDKYNGLQYLNATASFDWADGHILHSSDFYDHISSDPVRVCFCQNELIDCNSPHPTVFTKKGRTFTLSIVAMDQVGKPVNATLISSLTSGDGGIGRLKEGQEFRKVKSWCTTLEYNVYSINHMVELQLYADGPCSNQGISKQQVKISLLPCNCPIGLERFPPLIDCFCSCDRRLKTYVSNCSPVNYTIQINTNVWIDYINTSKSSGFVTPHCPFDYCVEKPINISLSSDGKTDQQCAFNRTGRICGQCQEGLSLVFAGSTCQECSNYSLFLLLPFTLAGVALVAFILTLNMTVATGTIHGLIFYTNMLAANRSVFLPFSTPNFLTVFISWLNLDLGIETCFYDGMNSYGKFLLQLTFPAYVFLIIVAIIALCNRSQRLAVVIGKRNPEATLYTLLLLSYSKLIRMIITALRFIVINYPDGTQKVVWHYDANVLYFNVSHIPRFLTASIIIILGTVYTTLLLFGQLFDRCSEHKLMKWVTHKYYTHFIRAHQAPLSDKHRYWVGLLLLVRLTHYLISAFAADSIVILSAGTMAFVLVIHKLLNKQIYNSWSLDLLETSFLVNLVVLALFTFYIRDASGSQQVLAFISMAVCFTTFLGIVVYHIIDKLGIKLSTLAQKALKSYRCRRCYPETAPHEEEEEELFDEDEHLIDTDEEQNYKDDNSTSLVHYHTPPIIRHAMRDDQLREPALDDLIPIQTEDYDVLPQPQPRHKVMVTFTEVDIRADQKENN